MIRRGLVVAAGALGLALLAGCRLATVIPRNVGALVSSPTKVPNRITDPVRKDARLAVLWVGHATALIQIDDKIILTDPVFTSAVGQVSKRLVEPGIDADHVPPIDVVLVSHMHFDHLSLGSLSMLERRIRMLCMPTGGVTYLTDFSFPVVELARWQPWEKDGLKVTAVPVDHVGFRYGLDDAWMKESFTGYVIEYHGIKVYFGGDTAYDQRYFVETGERFKDIDLALIPIAPIEPRDFMRRHHIDPQEAVQAFFDLGAMRMVPIHYDTFVNSADEPGDALRELQTVQAKYELNGRVIAPLKIGEQRVFLKQGDDLGHGKIRAIAPQAPRPSLAAPKLAPTSAPKSEPIPDDDKLD